MDDATGAHQGEQTAFGGERVFEQGGGSNPFYGGDNPGSYDYLCNEMRRMNTNVENFTSGYANDWRSHREEMRGYCDGYNTALGTISSNLESYKTGYATDFSNFRTEFRSEYQEDFRVHREEVDTSIGSMRSDFSLHVSREEARWPEEDRRWKNVETEFLAQQQQRELEKVYKEEQERRWSHMGYPPPPPQE